MPSLSNGLTVEISPPVTPAVEKPASTTSATVVPVLGPPGPPSEADVDAVLAAIEPPVALDVLYQNNLI